MLQNYGYRVLLFSNEAVLHHLNKVLETTVSSVEETPLPSPNPGRGKRLGDG